MKHRIPQPSAILATIFVVWFLLLAEAYAADVVPWEQDTFDGLSGSLQGKNGWTTAPGAFPAVLEAYPLIAPQPPGGRTDLSQGAHFWSVSRGSVAKMAR